MTTRKLAFIFSIVAAAALGACGDDSSSTKDGSVTIDSAVTVDAKVADTGTTVDGSSAQDGALTCSPTVTPKDVTNFCNDYQRICTFTGTGHYTSLSDCTTKYTAATAQQQCRTYHLCNSTVDTANMALHCQHAAGNAGFCQ